MHRLKHLTLSLLFFSFIIFLAVGQNAFAQTKQPITHESMWLMKRVGAPVPSPDGKWVVFSMTEPAYDEKEQVSDLWIVAANNGDISAKPRRLTSTKAGESGAAWSPDGTRIAFSAKRETDEANQIYVIDLAGGEAVRVTNISTGARNPQWRPDGKAILFVSSVYPGAMNDDDNKRIAKERKDRKYKARVFDSFPVRNWDHWMDDMQTHAIVQELADGAKAKDVMAGSKLVAEKGFGGRIGAGSDDIDAVWTPDGKEVVFLASANRSSAASEETQIHVYRVPATGGAEPAKVTSGAQEFGRPTFSPDGKTLYLINNVFGEKVFTLTRLVSIDWANGGQPKVLTANFDSSIGTFAVTPDSKTIYLTSESAGHEKIYMVPSSGGEVRPLTELNNGCYTNLSISSKSDIPQLFVNWDSAINPPEIYALGLGDEKSGKALTNFNSEALAKWDVQPVNEFWFTSKAGRRIHNMYVTPPNFDPKKKYPLFVVMHGGPHSQWRDNWGVRWNYHLLASPGYIVLLTNYTGSTGFGEKFAQGIQGDPFRTPADEINEAADEAIKRFPFVDGTRQCAAGASYGGHLANWMEATTTRYKCIVAHAGLVNSVSQWGTSDSIYDREKNQGGPHWENGPKWEEQNPIKMAKSFKTPILVTVGENDFRVPVNNSLENWAVLQRMKVPSRLIVFPEENHWILKAEDSRFFYSELQAWLKKWL
jgi:dipeptidyl aminopeptidase/acylaminoacyl peptidase